MCEETVRGVEHHLSKMILALLTGEFAHRIPQSLHLGALQLEQRVVGS